MNVLTIGNSFSQDATAYLRQMNTAGGADIQFLNLIIGGCSLSQHWHNVRSDAAEYYVEENGLPKEGFARLGTTLVARHWNGITLQQASMLSIDYATYQPYLSQLKEYIDTFCPKARLCIHQTWGYEDNCPRLHEMGLARQADMFALLEPAYLQAAQSIGAEIIPSGKAFELAHAAGIAPLHRDSFHAGLGAGRFLLAAVWYAFWSGRSAQALPAEKIELEEDIPLPLRRRLLAIADEALTFYKTPDFVY